MNRPLDRSVSIVAGALMFSVVTQVVYMLWLGGPTPSDPAAGTTHADRALYFTQRWPDVATVWSFELATFTLLAVAGIAAAMERPALRVILIALALSGLFNALQVSIGLCMFRPAVTAGEALEPLFATVLGGAFFFYFLAKALVGLAAIGVGLRLLAAPDSVAKLVGAIALLAGAAATVTNIGGMTVGRSLTYPAGLTGTLAALTAGLALWLIVGRMEPLDSSNPPG